MRALLLVVFLFGLGAQSPPRAPASDRTRAWMLWREINRQALGAKEGIPVWQVWCQDEEAFIDPSAGRRVTLGNERCVHRFIYAKGPNLRHTRQVPIPKPSGQGEPTDTFLSIHLNPELVERVLEYEGEPERPMQPEGFLVRSGGVEKYLSDNKDSPSHQLLPFGEPSQWYRSARAVKNRVPVAVKASWTLMNDEMVCVDSDKGTFKYFVAPASGVTEYGWDKWPNELKVDLTPYCTTRVDETGKKKYPKYRPPKNAIPLSRFHSFPVLVPREHDTEPGLALLNGLHVATRETKDWVWSTFYWDPDPKTHKYGGDRPDLPAPWDNYVMQTSKNQDDIIFNPYLEGRMKNGLKSNCMSCHRMAALGRTFNQMHCLTKIEDNAQAFLKNKIVLVDYLWTLANRGSPWSCNEFPAPPNWAPVEQPPVARE